ncbi:basic proline-rich protein-like [Tachyglossus aculeatus]|uniref:basic proline-rich protein-like n=1 Tax=Tachyglossus aculeatus TaxID=9261 RepID=UPI0018F61D1E|nr:basic proline-rich protein-like [Tachyglossus aculeatus]
MVALRGRDPAARAPNRALLLAHGQGAGGAGHAHRPGACGRGGGASSSLPQGRAPPTAVALRGRGPAARAPNRALLLAHGKGAGGGGHAHRPGACGRGEGPRRRCLRDAPPPTLVALRGRGPAARAPNRALLLAHGQGAGGAGHAHRPGPCGRGGGASSSLPQGRAPPPTVSLRGRGPAARAPTEPSYWSTGRGREEGATPTGPAHAAGGGASIAATAGRRPSPIALRGAGRRAPPEDSVRARAGEGGEKRVPAAAGLVGVATPSPGPQSHAPGRRAATGGGARSRGEDTRSPSPGRARRAGGRDHVFPPPTGGPIRGLPGGARCPDPAPSERGEGGSAFPRQTPKAPLPVARAGPVGVATPALPLSVDLYKGTRRGRAPPRPRPLRATGGARFRGEDTRGPLHRSHGPPRATVGERVPAAKRAVGVATRSRPLPADLSGGSHQPGPAPSEMGGAFQRRRGRWAWPRAPAPYSRTYQGTRWGRAPPPQRNRGGAFPRRRGRWAWARAPAPNPRTYQGARWGRAPPPQSDREGERVPAAKRAAGVATRSRPLPADLSGDSLGARPAPSERPWGGSAFPRRRGRWAWPRAPAPYPRTYQGTRWGRAPPPQRNRGVSAFPRRRGRRAWPRAPAPYPRTYQGTRWGRAPPPQSDRGGGARSRGEEGGGRGHALPPPTGGPIRGLAPPRPRPLGDRGGAFPRRRGRRAWPRAPAPRPRTYQGSRWGRAPPALPPRWACPRPPAGARPAPSRPAPPRPVPL